MRWPARQLGELTAIPQRFVRVVARAWPLPDVAVLAVGAVALGAPYPYANGGAVTRSLFAAGAVALIALTVYTRVLWLRALAPAIAATAFVSRGLALIVVPVEVSTIGVAVWFGFALNTFTHAVLAAPIVDLK